MSRGINICITFAMMKTILTILALSISIAASASHPEISRRLAEYTEACVTMRDGVLNHDRYALMDARETFGSVLAKPYRDFKVERESCKGALGNPTMQFNEIYCDSLLANGFRLVELDDLSAMRGKEDNPEVLCYCASLAGDAEVQLSFLASGDCGLTIVTADALPIESALALDSTPIRFTSRDKGSVRTAAWKMDGLGYLTLTLRNPNSTRQTFVVALQ